MDNGSIWDLFQNTPNYDGGRSSMGGSVGVGGYFCRWAPSRPWARWAALTTSRLRPALTVDLESGRTWNNPTSVRFLIILLPSCGTSLGVKVTPCRNVLSSYVGYHSFLVFRCQWEIKGQGSAQQVSARTSRILETKVTNRYRFQFLPCCAEQL